MELLKALRDALAEELSGAERGVPDSCPWCGYEAFMKRGCDADGKWRWLCRECGRTFSAKSQSLLGASKFDAGTWMEFAACMADGLHSGRPRRGAERPSTPPGS